MAELERSLVQHDKEMNEHLQGRVVNNLRANEVTDARKASEVLLFATNKLINEGNIKATMRKYKIIADISNKVHGDPKGK